MITLLTHAQVVELHRRVIMQSGGSLGIRDVGGLESAIAQPQMSFGGNDLYLTIPEKAAALGYALIQNHPFIDGNKRIGHAAMESFLVMNGFELNAQVDEAEKVILDVAVGAMSRHDFLAWVQARTMSRVA